jgi:hypothetical protein
MLPIQDAVRVIAVPMSNFTGDEERKSLPPRMSPANKGQHPRRSMRASGFGSSPNLSTEATMAVPTKEKNAIPL